MPPRRRGRQGERARSGSAAEQASTAAPRSARASVSDRDFQGGGLVDWNRLVAALHKYDVEAGLVSPQAGRRESAPDPRRSLAAMASQQARLPHTTVAAKDGTSVRAIVQEHSQSHLEQLMHDHRAIRHLASIRERASSAPCCAPRGSAAAPGGRAPDWHRRVADGAHALRVEGIEQPRCCCVRCGMLASFKPSDLYFTVLSLSWPAFFLIAFVNYLLVVLLFALAYFWLDPSACIEGGEGFNDAFFLSVHTFTTVGYGSFYPICNSAEAVVVFESFLGLVATSVITGVLYAKFSKPEPRIEFANVLAIDSGTDRPSGETGRLTLRVANIRDDVIFTAHMSLTVAFRDLDDCDVPYLRREELTFERPDSPSFYWVWMLTHRITPDSLLWGLTQEIAEAVQLRFIATFNGVDSVLNDTVIAQKEYAYWQLRFDARYLSMVRHEHSAGLGTTQSVLDFKLLHETVDADACVAMPSPAGAGGAGGAAADGWSDSDSDIVGDRESTAHDSYAHARGRSASYQAPAPPRSGRPPRVPVRVKRLRDVRALQRLTSTRRPGERLLIKLYSHKCAQCRLLQPAWRDAVAALHGRVRCAEAEAFEALDVFEALSVKAYPTLLLFDGAAQPGAVGAAALTPTRQVVGRRKALGMLEDELAHAGLPSLEELSRAQGPPAGPSAPAAAETACAAPGADGGSAAVGGGAGKREELGGDDMCSEVLSDDGGSAAGAQLEVGGAGVVVSLDDVGVSVSDAGVAVGNVPPGLLGTNVLEVAADAELYKAADHVHAAVNGVHPVGVRQLFAGRTVAVIGMPGAFTGLCSSEHLPAWSAAALTLLAAGVHEIVCVMRNDVVVLEAWGGVIAEEVRAASSSPTASLGVSLYSDLDGAFTRALRLQASYPGLGERSERFALLLRDGVVEAACVEPASDALRCSNPSTMLRILRGQPPLGHAGT